jgi:hypothetical protein
VLRPRLAFESRKVYAGTEMSIENPLDQALSRVSADQRQSGPAAKVLNSGLTFAAVIANAIKAWQTGNPGDAIRALSSGVKALSDAIGDSNSEYLLSVIIPEVQRLCDRFDELEVRHRSYLDTDWLTLLADADHKARVTRGRDRVKRIAVILSDSARRPDQPSDEAEDLMRVAMSLTDLEVTVLAELVKQQEPYFNSDSGRANYDDVNRYWAGADRHGYQQRNRMPAVTLGISEGELQTACAKLQSFGLVVQIDRSSTFGVLGLPPFSTLSRGIKFVESIKSFAEART